jgi:hypothetical protein
MALGLGAGLSGSGVIQFVDGATGQPQVTGRYLSQSQGRDAVSAREGVIYLARDPRGPSLEETEPGGLFGSGGMARLPGAAARRDAGGIHARGRAALHP